MAPSRASFVLLRDELLEREAFDTLIEAKVLIERWRQHYNTIRPHSALGYRPPAPPGVAAPCVRMAYASANARGWSIGGQNPNLRTGVIHGGRSKRTCTFESIDKPGRGYGGYERFECARTDSGIYNICHDNFL